MCFSFPFLLAGVDFAATEPTLTLLPCIYTVGLVRLVGTVKLSTDTADLQSCTYSLPASESCIYRFAENMII